MCNFRMYLRFITLHWVECMCILKCEFMQTRNKQTKSIDLKADICGRCRQTDYTHPANLNLFYIRMMPSNAWCIAHSFTRSIASLVHTQKHTYGDFTYVYATLPSIQLHLQRNNKKKRLSLTTSAIIAHKTIRSTNFRYFKEEEKNLSKK